MPYKYTVIGYKGGARFQFNGSITAAHVEDARYLVKREYQQFDQLFVLVH